MSSHVADYRSVQVAGNASAEEVAAVVAALVSGYVAAQQSQGDEGHVDPYERWRATRLRVLRGNPA